MAALTVTDASSSSQLEEFVSMREAGELLDYVIKGSNESFSIHSLVLASTREMFKALLKSKMKESEKREVEFPTIPDCIMRKILDFAYSRTCTFAKDELMPLFEAANFLQMTKLLQLCEESIPTVLEPSNCFSWLRFADRLELRFVKLQVRNMMFTSHKNVIRSNEFHNAEMSEVAEYLNYLSKRNIHVDVLSQAILQWAKHDSPNRSVHITELLVCISIGQCKHQALLSEMAKENHFQNVSKVLSKNVSQLDEAQTLLILGGQSADDDEPNNECWILEDNELMKFAEGSQIKPPHSGLVPQNELDRPAGGTAAEQLLLSVAEGFGNQLKPQHSMCQVPQGVMLTGGEYSKMCKLFDVTNKTWMDKADLLSVRSRHGSGYLDGKMFVIGGELELDLGYGLTLHVDYMDLNANTWQHGPNIPEREIFPKVAVCNSMLYVLLTYEGKLYCLDGEEMSWTEKSDIPTASDGCSLVTVDDRIFVAGGENNINCMYTAVSDTWCRLTGPRLQYESGSLVYYRQKLLLIGGKIRDTRSSISSDEDDEQEDWVEYFIDISSGRSFTARCIQDNQLQDVEEYDINSDTWSLSAWHLPNQLRWHGAFVFDRSLVFP